MKEEIILKYDVIDSLFFFIIHTSISFLLFSICCFFDLDMGSYSFMCFWMRSELSMSFDNVDPCFVHITLFVCHLPLLGFC